MRDEGDDRHGIRHLRSVRFGHRHGYMIQIFGEGAHYGLLVALLLLGLIPVGKLIETVHHRREVAA